MKLLIPNAKELNTNQDAFANQTLGPKSRDILEVMLDYSVEDLASFYKINPVKADQEWLRWQRMANKDARYYSVKMSARLRKIISISTFASQQLFTV